MAVAPLYAQTGNGFLPQAAAASPWAPKFQSGIPIAGLLAHFCENARADAPMMLARISIDILRPAPMELTETRCVICHEDGASQHLEASLLVGGVEVARATAMRVASSRLPPMLPQTAYPPPDEAPDRPINRRIDPGMESRVLFGGLTERGPGAAWVRPTVEIITGRSVSPVVAAAMGADFGGALSSVHDGRVWSFANVDLCIHYFRPPVSEWIRVESVMLTEGMGSALVDMRLADLQGDFARAHQTLFIAPQPSRESGTKS